MTAARCRHCRSAFPSVKARDDHEGRCGANLDAREAARALVEATSGQLAVARTTRDDAIRAARAAGMSNREIARAAGLSHVRVVKICQEAGA